MTTLYRYAWRNDDQRCSPPEWKPKRPTMHGRKFRVIAHGALNSALVEFTDDGQREVISRNAKRRVTP